MTKLKYVEGNCYCKETTAQQLGDKCKNCGGDRNIEPLAKVVKERKTKKIKKEKIVN